ncbi:hypothetical protein PMIN04_004672 [Paraphaeosphaeria minitans]
MQCLQSAMWDFILKRKFKFVPLNDKDADDDMDRENLLPSGAQPRIRRGLSWHLFVLCIVSTACLSVILGAWIGNATRWDADAFSIRHTSQYSPIIEDITIQYTALPFNGSLLASNPFRLDAGPEVDAAWKSLGADCTAPFPLFPITILLMLTYPLRLRSAYTSTPRRQIRPRT